MTPARTTVATVLLAAALGLLAGTLLDSGVVGDPGISDTPVYRSYGERIVSGEIPYRDFGVEYPPLALPAFALPALVSSSREGYDDAFAGSMIASLACLAALVALSLRLLGATPRRALLGPAALLAGMLLLGPFTLTRFDLLPATLTAAALAALLGRRDLLGSGLLGAAIAVKLYPAVLLPLVVARAWRRDGRAEAVRVLSLTLAVTAIAYLPFAIVSPEGTARSLWRQLGRPLQIESLGAGILLAIHHVFAMPLGWASSSGSQNLTGTVAAAASGLTTLAGAVAILAVWVGYARGEPGNDRFLRYAAAAAVAFVAFGKVLSPQFLVWLLPLVPLVRARRGFAAATGLLVACALTRAWFPGGYWELVKEFDWRLSSLVLVRDVVLVGVLLALAGARIRARRRAPSRSPAPAPSPGRSG